MDLLLRRAQPRPVAALGEGEGVEVARHVAGRAGVGVVEPGAAEVGRALEDRDVLDAVTAQLDRGGDAAEARADDQHAQAALPLGCDPISATDTRLLLDSASRRANLMRFARHALGGGGPGSTRAEPAASRPRARGDDAVAARELVVLDVEAALGEQRSRRARPSRPRSPGRRCRGRRTPAAPCARRCPAPSPATVGHEAREARGSRPASGRSASRPSA